jgi:hypothetical protein
MNVDTEEVNGTFPSPILSEACKVEVTVSFSGTRRIMTFPNRPVGPTDVTIDHIVWRANAGDNEVRFENVGTEVTQVEPDGTITFKVTGHHPPIPGEITGVIKTNAKTDEIIMQSHNVPDPTRLCHLLTR